MASGGSYHIVNGERVLDECTQTQETGNRARTQQGVELRQTEPSAEQTDPVTEERTDVS